MATVPVAQNQVSEFVRRWERSGSAERGNFQSFAKELGDLLAVPHPDPQGHTRRWATYVSPRSEDRRGEGLRLFWRWVSSTFTRLLVLVNVAAAWALLASRAHHAANRPISELTPVERAAGLDRVVPQLVLSSVPLDESLQRLAAVSGTRIVRSETLPTLPEQVFSGKSAWQPIQNPPEWKRTIWLKVHGVTVAAALDSIMSQCDNAFRVPITYAALDDGSIFVGGEQEMPRIMRAYELGPVMRAIGPEQRDYVYANEYATPQRELAWLPFAQSSDDDRLNYSGARTECIGTTLIVVASLRWQRYVAQIVRQLRGIDHPWPEASRDGVRDRVLTELHR